MNKEYPLSDLCSKGKITLEEFNNRLCEKINKYHMDMGSSYRTKVIQVVLDGKSKRGVFVNYGIRAV